MQLGSRYATTGYTSHAWYRDEVAGPRILGIVGEAVLANMQIAVHLHLPATGYNCFRLVECEIQ